MDLRERFRAHLGTLALPSRRLLVAVSGGPDSVALLDLLSSGRDELALELTVAHVDHGIYADSAQVAARVRALAAAYGVHCLVRELTLGAGTGETEARAARYAALEALRLDADAGAIVTAHHADDQAETVLMRVLGGSGPAGLAGMSPVAGRVVRPLLPFRREELARHVHALGLSTWDDPANRDLRHERSWVRGEVLPLLRVRIPDVEHRLLRVAAHARADRTAWAGVLDALPGLDVREDGPVISVAAEPLGRIDFALAIGLVRALARRWGRPIGPVRAERVLRLVHAGASGNQVPLGARAVAELAFGRLRFVADSEPAGDRWELGGDAGERVSGRWRFVWRRAPAPPVQLRHARTAWFEPPSAALTVRPWRSGDRLRPLGGRGRRLLVRCFQDARVPRSSRAAWPVIEHAGLVAWVPGVCRSDLLVPAAGVEALRVDAELA
jgi:tRNA(Ile)-lysidine synthase